MGFVMFHLWDSECAKVLKRGGGRRRIRDDLEVCLEERGSNFYV
jgi:hypothetical protein